MLVGKFINRLMLDGKKSTAERVMYGALSETTPISQPFYGRYAVEIPIDEIT